MAGRSASPISTGRSRPVGKKVGNLRYAFARTSAEYLVILDADFAPRRDFLAETLPYLDDPAIAIVQTPQYFRTSRAQTWIERAGADPGGVLTVTGFRFLPAARRGRLLRDLRGLPADRARAAGRPDAHRPGRAYRARCAPGRLVHGLPAHRFLPGSALILDAFVREQQPPALRERGHRVLVAAVGGYPFPGPGWPTSPGSSITPTPHHVLRTCHAHRHAGFPARPDPVANFVVPSRRC